MVHLFLHLLLEANHEDKKWQGIIVKRGQLVTGRQALSRDTGISVQTIRTCLKRLQQTGEIIQKSTKKFSIITLCNYEDYQDRDDEANQQLTINQPSTNHKLTTNKNDKNKILEDKSSRGHLPAANVPPNPKPEKVLTEEEKAKIRQEKEQRKKDTEDILIAFGKVTGTVYQMKIKDKYTTNAIKVGDVLKSYKKNDILNTISFYEKEWTGGQSKDGKDLRGFVRPETICASVARFKKYFESAYNRNFTVVKNSVSQPEPVRIKF